MTCSVVLILSEEQVNIYNYIDWVHGSQVRREWFTHTWQLYVHIRWASYYEGCNHFVLTIWSCRLKVEFPSLSLVYWPWWRSADFSLGEVVYYQRGGGIRDLGWGLFVCFFAWKGSVEGCFCLKMGCWSFFCSLKFSNFLKDVIFYVK